MNALSWFEIPVADMKRAVKFYEATLNGKLREETFFGTLNAIFPYERGEHSVGGALVLDAKKKPSKEGTTVYLPVDDVDAAVARAKKAGAAVIAPKIDIGDMGIIALLVDTEGNQIGLHAEKH
jgi:predicted enzyme related to lactoylglutathione lyase